MTIFLLIINKESSTLNAVTRSHKPRYNINMFIAFLLLSLRRPYIYIHTYYIVCCFTLIRVKAEQLLDLPVDWFSHRIKLS